jgi:hypothetical protein
MLENGEIRAARTERSVFGSERALWVAVFVLPLILNLLYTLPNNGRGLFQWTLVVESPEVMKMLTTIVALIADFGIHFGPSYALLAFIGNPGPNRRHSIGVFSGWLLLYIPVLFVFDLYMICILFHRCM